MILPHVSKLPVALVLETKTLSFSKEKNPLNSHHCLRLCLWPNLAYHTIVGIVCQCVANGFANAWNIGSICSKIFPLSSLYQVTQWGWGPPLSQNQYLVCLLYTTPYSIIPIQYTLYLLYIFWLLYCTGTVLVPVCYSIGGNLASL